MILSRLKKWLRKWLLSDDAPKVPSLVLKCIIKDKVKGTQLIDLFVVGTVGLRLSGKLIGAGRGDSVRLIGENQAVDNKHFWEVWRHFNRGVKLTWEREEGDPE